MIPAINLSKKGSILDETNKKDEKTATP